MTEISEISKVIHEVNNIVSTIIAAVEEQSTTTQEISGSVAQTSLIITEVNQNVTQGSVVAKEIAEDIADVIKPAIKYSNFIFHKPAPDLTLPGANVCLNNCRVNNLSTNDIFNSSGQVNPIVAKGF